MAQHCAFAIVCPSSWNGLLPQSILIFWGHLLSCSLLQGFSLLQGLQRRECSDWCFINLQIQYNYVFLCCECFSVRKLKVKPLTGGVGKWEFEVGQDVQRPNLDSEGIVESSSNVISIYLFV